MNRGKKNDWGTVQPIETVANGMTRREAARRLLGAVSTGAFLRFGVAEHPVWKHLADEEVLHRAESAGAASSPKFLNAQQYSSLVTIGEAIVPGSTKANVAEFIDLLLSVDAEKNQKEFLKSLQRVESESQKKFAKNFSGLSEAQRSDLLGTFTELTAAGGETEADAAFKNLKVWISGAYYSSEVGIKELGWTPNRFFPQFPGCEHAEGHGSD